MLSFPEVLQLQYVQLALILNRCGAHKRAPLFPRSLVQCNCGRTDLLTISGRICDVHYTCLRGKVRSINVPLCSLNRNSVVACCSQYSYVNLLLQYFRIPNFWTVDLVVSRLQRSWFNMDYTIRANRVGKKVHGCNFFRSFARWNVFVQLSNRTKAKVIRCRKKDGDWYIYP